MPEARAVIDPPQVAVVATTGPWGLGGLAAYERNLLLRLPPATNPTCSVRFAAATHRGLDYAARERRSTRHLQAVPVSTLGPRLELVPVLRAASKLVHHRIAHRAVVATAVAAWRRDLEATVADHTSVIHSVGCGQELLGFAALFAARRRGVPLTLWPAVHIDSWGDGPLDLALYRAADGVFVQTEAERAHLERRGVPAERLFRCGPGPDCPLDGDGDRFRTEHQAGGRPLVLFLGRKTRSKGYHRLREAMHALREQVPDALLVAIGEDREPPYPGLPSEAVLDLGAADQATKADALAACDVMCLPSRGEAFGIAYVEAWAYGKPVVALDTPVSRSLISPGHTGLLVSERERNLVEALAALLSDHSLRVAIGGASHDMYRELYTWDAVIDTHLAVFSKLITRRPRASWTLAR